MIHILIRFCVLVALWLGIVALARQSYELATAPFQLPALSDAASSQALSTEAEPAKYAAPSLATFPQTLSRPIFFPGRKYPERAPPAPVTAPEPEAAPATPVTQASAANLKLRGVAKTAAGWKALIQAEEPAPAWVETDQTIGNWRVLKIDENSVVLSSPQGEATLALYPPQSVN